MSGGDANPTTYSVSQPQLGFEEAFALAALQGQFDRLRVRRFDVIHDRARILTGADGICLQDFIRDQNNHLRAISRKVIQGRYTFSPFRGVDIPKAGTKDTRPISISTIRDTIVQRSLYDYLYPRVDPLLTDSVFGYRAGRSAHDAIRTIVDHARAGCNWILDADLSKFFDTVDHELLLSKTQQLEIDPRAQTLIRRYLRTGRITPEEVKAVQEARAAGQQTKYRPELRDVGVPQGGVLSGVLANLFLAGFDRAVRATHPGYIRYADDFVICCKSEEECQRAYALTARELATIRLSLNGKKTRPCVAIANGIDFLGFRLDGKQVRVRGANIHKFKARVTNDVFLKQRIHSNHEATLRSLVRRLNFKICGPNEEQRKKLTTILGVPHPHRRSWVGFFRIVTDVDQIARLDRWLRREISRFMWARHKVPVRYKAMRAAGLQSLVGHLFKCRSRKS